MGNCILIIDDEPAQCQLVKLMLGRRGYEAFAVGAGQDAFDFLAENAVDLIILDMMLPEMSGLDVFRVLRDTPEWRHIPVLFATGSGRVYAEIEAGVNGVVAVLVKPFLQDKLIENVRIALGDDSP